MPTPEIYEELRQMATRLQEIVEMYAPSEDSTESEEFGEGMESSPLSNSPSKVSAAMKMFKGNDEY